MLRVLLGLIVGANALFFGWTQGWFAPTWPGPHAGEREPERLAAQVRPERVLLLPAPAASAAISAARAAALACLEAGPLSDSEATAAEAALPAASMPAGSWQRVALPPPLRWLVTAGRAQDAAALQARTNELKQAQLAFELLDAPPELANTLVLSRHPTQAEAEAALDKLAAVPVRRLKVQALPTVPAQVALRVAQADADQQDRLRALPAAGLGGGFKPCTARP
jgi:hypothetical protein